MQDAFRQYDSDVASTYDKDREIEEHWAVEDRFIADYMVSARIDKLLDVPTGTGRFFRHFAKVGHIVAVDASTEMLEIARARAEELGLRQATISAGNIFSLDFEDRSFDLTICWRFLHLMAPDRLAPAISELGRVTRGRLLLQVYVRGSWASRLREHLRRWATSLSPVAAGPAQQPRKRWSHIRAYFHEARQVEDAAAAAGLVVERRQRLCDYQGHAVEVFFLAPPPADR